MPSKLFTYRASELTRMDLWWGMYLSIHCVTIFCVLALFVYALSPDSIFVLIGILHIPLYLARAVCNYGNRTTPRFLVANGKSLAIVSNWGRRRFLRKSDHVSCRVGDNALVHRSLCSETLWDPRHADGDIFRHVFLIPLCNAWWPDDHKVSVSTTTEPCTEYGARVLNNQLLGLLLIAPITVFMVKLGTGAITATISIPSSVLLLASLGHLFFWHWQTRKSVRSIRVQLDSSSTTETFNSSGSTSC